MPTDPRAPQVDPRLSPGQYAQNVSAGLGYGLTNQLRGVEQLVRDPVTAFRESLTAIGQLASNPAVALQMLRELRQRAAAGPLGFGEVTGELLPTPGRRPPSNALRMAAAPKKPTTLAQAFRVSPQSLHAEKLNSMSAEELESLADDLYEEIQSVSDDARSFGPNYAIQEPAGYLFEYLQNNAGKFTGDWNSIVRDFLASHVDKNPQRVGQALRAAGRSVAQYRFNEPDAVKEVAKAMTKNTPTPPLKTP
jgi:hypothetical protein